MSTPNGYNNPAYCHQYDSSVYDYQYVPEIDPDSPDLNQESNKRKHQTIHLGFNGRQREVSESDEFENSDESNRSIIIEECNNRRVTLICEKRNKNEAKTNDRYEDENYAGTYYQDISLESENGYDNKGDKIQSGCDERSLRHRRSLEPPAEQINDIRDHYQNKSNKRQTSSATSFNQPTSSKTGFTRPQRYHRYEEIASEEDYVTKEPPPRTSVHRYAEISCDENGYPTLTKEIKVEKNREYYPFDNRSKENYNPRVVSKPRTISPINYPKSFSPPSTPIQTYQRTPYSRDTERNGSSFSLKSASPLIFSSSPLKANSFEMSELSPPRSSESFKYSDSNQTFFIQSPKRQPPIGASAACDSQEPYQFTTKCILPKNLQEISSRGKERSHSLPNTPKRKRNLTEVSDSSKAHSDRKISQIFHLKPVKSNQAKHKSTPRARLFVENENYPARRNISNSFSNFPQSSFTSSMTMQRSPYKPTTEEIVPPKTAIITPIFQRKNQGNLDQFSSKRNFEKMSQAFQSTGNIFRGTRELSYTGENDLQERLPSPARIKRNQSVPNFCQTLEAERRITKKSPQAFHQSETQKYSRNLDLQYSPKKPLELVTYIDKPKISQIESSKSSWSISEPEYQPQCTYCFILAALVHLVTSTATCAICFYLLSKVGRKYYLDFGLLAGFVNFILGLLGFRSYCWRWLPNRNYVSGFIGLAVFSFISCAGLTYLVTAKPMAGDPILDIMGGAICAVSVLTIALALTGLTMSGCCKAPPPDNRVTDI